MNRLRPLVASLALFALASAPGCLVRGRATGHVRLAPAVVVVDQEPPAPRPVVVQPRAGMVWVTGRWEWNGNQWVWVDGQYIESRADYVWIDGQWEHRGTRWHWVEGRWEGSGSVRGGGQIRDHREGGANPMPSNVNPMHNQPSQPVPNPMGQPPAPQPAPVPVPAAPVDPNHAAHEHPHAHPHPAGDHHHHPHAHPHRPGETHHHPY